VRIEGGTFIVWKKYSIDTYICVDRYTTAIIQIQESIESRMENIDYEGIEKIDNDE